jgi:hypothetical protein
MVNADSPGRFEKTHLKCFVWRKQPTKTSFEVHILKEKHPYYDAFFV